MTASRSRSASSTSRIPTRGGSRRRRCRPSPASTIFWACAFVKRGQSRPAGELRSLPQIDGFLKANRLRLLGFELPAPIMQRYSARFPEDAAGTNLELWDRFEHEHPETFSGMYYFWVQRGD
jgi:hypothetical protein